MGTPDTQGRAPVSPSLLKAQLGTATESMLWAFSLEMNNGECWKSPPEEFNLEGLLFNSPYFFIIRTNSLLVQFPFPKVEGIQETSPKMLSPALSLSRHRMEAALPVILQNWWGLQQQLVHVTSGAGTASPLSRGVFTLRQQPWLNG